MPRICRFCLLAFFMLAGGLLSACGRFQPPPKHERIVPTGVFFRYQFSADPCVPRRFRHVHVLLDNQHIYGFNQRPGQATFLSYAFLRRPGEVRDLARLRSLNERKHYISIEAAKDCVDDNRPGEQMITAWFTFNITPAQAKQLNREWRKLQAAPPLFRLWGLNCATRTAEIYARAGIIPDGELSWLDSPESLWRELRRYYPQGRLRLGYFGYDAASRPQFEPLPADCQARLRAALGKP